jgi:LysM repeat protein
MSGTPSTQAEEAISTHDVQKKDLDTNTCPKERMTVPLIDVESDEDHEQWPDVALDDRTKTPRDEGMAKSRAAEAQDHREHDQEDEGHEEEDVDRPSTSTSYISADDEKFEGLAGDTFVRHRVRQKDTLAGLAVKYKVSISDIKRANGYQNESALYGKEWVVIPTKPLPIDPEHAAWAGMILAHYEGRLAMAGVVDGDQMVDPISPGGLRIDEGERMLLSAAAQKGVESEVELMRSDLLPAQDPLPANDRLRSRTSRHRTTKSMDGYRVDELRDAATREFFDAMREKDAAPLFSATTSAKLNAWKEKSSTIAIRELRDFQSRSIRWRDTIFSKIKKISSQPAMNGICPSAGATPQSHRNGSTVDDGLKKD